MKTDAVETFCDRVTEAGCSFAGGGEDTCVARMGEIRDKAYDRGCTSEFDAYIDCAAGVFEDSCTAGDEGVDKACPTQTAELGACDSGR